VEERDAGAKQDGMNVEPDLIDEARFEERPRQLGFQGTNTREPSARRNEQFAALYSTSSLSSFKQPFI